MRPLNFNNMAKNSKNKKQKETSEKVWVSNSKLLKSVENRRQGVRRVEGGKIIGGLEFYGELK